jgi:hypothetical protein
LRWSTWRERILVKWRDERCIVKLESTPERGRGGMTSWSPRHRAGADGGMRCKQRHIIGLYSGGCCAPWL